MSIVVLEHSDDSPSARFGVMLQMHGHKLDIRRLHRGDPLPVDLDGVDGVVSCGGSPSANDDSLEWLAAELDLLEAAHTADLPIVGLCLGSQILARALGGRVETMPGIEFGWHRVRLSDAGKNDIAHAGVGWTTIPFHYHYDQVTRLPDGTVQLASSERCENQAWRLGHRTYAFQYHPEVDLRGIEKWVAAEPSLFDEAGLTAGELSEQNARYAADMIRVTDRIFERIALLVMPVDRRVAGLPKEIHH